jgi:hypothetical protein
VNPLHFAVALRNIGGADRVQAAKRREIQPTYRAGSQKRLECHYLCGIQVIAGEAEAFESAWLGV